MNTIHRNTVLMLVVFTVIAAMFWAILSNVEQTTETITEKCAAAGGTWLYREQKCIAAKEIKL